MSPWLLYSKKLKQSILKPRSAGIITNDDAKLKGMRLVSSLQGRMIDGLVLCLYFLVDEEDGIIADAKFQAFGPSFLIGSLEVVCNLCIRKNYDQASRLTAELIDKELRDTPKTPAFPKVADTAINMCLSAITDALENCDDIPLSDSYAPPTPFKTSSGSEHKYANWLDISESAQRQIVETIVQEDIRPYIELDDGGIKIQEISGLSIKISYQGACTTCYSATGATLSAIQNILQDKIHPDIQVIPDLENLSF